LIKTKIESEVSPARIDELHQGALEVFAKLKNLIAQNGDLQPEDSQAILRLVELGEDTIDRVRILTSVTILPLARLAIPEAQQGVTRKKGGDTKANNEREKRLGRNEQWQHDAADLAQKNPKLSVHAIAQKLENEYNKRLSTETDPEQKDQLKQLAKSDRTIRKHIRKTW